MKILHRDGRVLYADDGTDIKTTLVAAVAIAAIECLDRGKYHVPPAGTEAK